MAKTATRRDQVASGAGTWQPPHRWTLADGVGATLLVVLVFAWPGVGDGSAITALVLLVGGFSCLPFAVWRWTSNGGDTRLGLLPVAAAVALLIWGIASALLSGAPWQVSVYGWLGRSDGLLTLLAVVSLLIAASSLTLREVDRVVTWLLVAGAVAIAEVAAQLSGLPYPPRADYDGVSAALGNPNFFAAVSAILGLLALGRALGRSRPPWQRAAALALALGLGWSCVLTGSLQGPVILILGAVAGGIVWSIQHRGRGRGPALCLSAAAASLGLLAFALITLEVGPFARVREIPTLRIRESYWEAAWRMMNGLPIFGSGPDGFERYVSEFRGEAYLQSPGSVVRVSAAHDIPLQYGATFGVIGLLAWLALMVSVGVLLFRALMRGTQQVWLVASLAGAWVAYLAQAMVSIDAPALKALGWAISGLIVAAVINRDTVASPGGSWRPWLSGALALSAVLIWWPSLSATMSASGETTVDGAVGAVTNSLVPCQIRQQSLAALAEVIPANQLNRVAQEAFVLDRRCPGLAIIVSGLALTAGDVATAETAASVAVETDPLSPGSWYVLSLVRDALGDESGAAAAMAESERLAAIDRV